MEAAETVLPSVKPVDPNKVAVYIRWSTDEQGQGTTLAVQREACEHYCRSQGWNFREDLVFVDDGFSAGDLQRPALTRLREAVRAGLVECVVVYKLDRLSRNLLDCVWLVRQEWGGRCALFSTRENFDTSSPVGQMVFNILVSFAEFERNMIRERTLSGKRKRAEQGRNAGQRYPYGYRKGSGGGWELDGRDGEPGGLAGPAAIVRRIFTEYLSGAGTVTIAQRLNAEGIPAPMGGQWRAGAIARILGNPVYAGRYLYGRQRGGPGRREDGPAPAVGAVPGIVTEAEFAAVQRRRRERAASPPRALHGGFLLSGIARCRRCGGALTGATGRHKRYYVCSSRARRPAACDGAWIDAERLEAALLAEIRALIPPPDARQQIGRLQAEIRQRIREHTHAVALARAEAAAVERKRRRLDEAFFAGSLEAGVYGSRARELEAELARAREWLRRAEAALQAVQAAAAGAEARAGRAGPIDPWAELSLEEQKQALRELVATLCAYQPPARAGGRQRRPGPLLIEWRPRLDTTPSHAPGTPACPPG